MNDECDKCGENALKCKCPIIRVRKWISKEEAKQMFPVENVLHAIECECQECLDKWENLVIPQKCLSIHAPDGYETYAIDANTIGIRPKWISVKDKPPPNGWILIAYRYYANPNILCSDFGLHQYGCFLSSGLERDVTHWMPLPQPPGTVTTLKENT